MGRVGADVCAENGRAGSKSAGSEHRVAGSGSASAMACRWGGKSGRRNKRNWGQRKKGRPGEDEGRPDERLAASWPADRRRSGGGTLALPCFSLATRDGWASRSDLEQKERNGTT
jgi:hypothetical protein